jgi:hypothetical protein
MVLNRVFAVTASVAALGVALSGCAAAGRALGVTKVTPDEFRVVTKAPLAVPPDYSLRPPAPGQPRPQELQPESAARVALLGSRQGEARTEGEKLLVAKAGADKADPLVRYVVDDEFGDIAHKDASFADHVMFWKKNAAPAPTATQTATAAGANTAAPIDPKIEAERLKSLTGDKPVVIQREASGVAIKLPGL